MGELEKKKSDPLDEIDPTFFETLTSKQIKYVQLSVATQLDRGTIAKNLGVSKRMLTRWDKDPNIVSLKSQYKQILFRSEAEDIRVQKKVLRDKAFTEALRRFDEPPELTDEMTLSEKKEIKEQYAKYAKFPHIIKALKTIDEMDGEDSAQQSQDELIADIRRRYIKKKVKRNKLRDAMNANNLEAKSYKELITENGVDYYEADESYDEPVERDEEVVVEEEFEEISILRRNKDE